MKNEIIDTVRLDIGKSEVNTCLYVREGDTRTFEFILMNNGQTVDLSKAITTAIIISDKSGNKSYQAMTRYDNKLSYTLHDVDVAEAGEFNVMIQAGFEGGYQVTSPLFSMIVEELPINMDKVVTQSEYGVLITLEDNCRTYSVECENAVSIADQLVSDAREIIKEQTALEHRVEELLDKAGALQLLLEGTGTVTPEDVHKMWDGTYVPEPAEEVSE